MIIEGPSQDREAELALNVGFLEEDFEKPASDLSMGDLRKLELARTIATGAKVLLLDEVFAGLTTGEIAQISTLVQNLRAKGFTLLMVSHDQRLSKQFDRVVCMEDIAQVKRIAA